VKYLIMEDFSGRSAVFIFPRRVDHADMREQLPYQKALAAGYVTLEKDVLRCFGGHPELGLRSRPEDADFIRSCLRQEDNE
jgi:hypothetical protein